MTEFPSWMGRWAFTMGELISTDVYCKPTDVHQYLNFGSCHPPHVKRGTHYGQGLRLKRICSSEEVLERRLSDLKGFLVERGMIMTLSIIPWSIQKKLGNKDTFGDRVCCVVDYHLVRSCLNKIFKHLQDIVLVYHRNLLWFS